ncbi:SDR family oxidoreductase [Sphingomonas gei]|uniref:SDR family oxidoreductase n=1 Tax=Sphingomonas gei TaxID=1395960 RepID=A0A4S1XI17_9SPHN|nr:SDR family oxidoreductase [Sphingomonas gei]TGX55738.1 SDR family oxidoreductase [Sphingomonas gei]
MKIVVVGGTGLIGSRLVRELALEGHDVVVAARSTGVDIVAGAGLAQALDGAEVVVDLSNPGYADPGEMLRFFEASGANLLAAEHRAGVTHHVTFSAIGSDRITNGYFLAKNAQEDLVVASNIPFTIIRSAPLFEYIYDIVGAQSDRPAVRLPPVRLRPIAADDAARALARVALGAPENAVVEIAGPDTYALSSLAGQILTANDDLRPVIVDDAAPFFGGPVSEPLAGGMYPQIGATDFEDWLHQSLTPA